MTDYTELKRLAEAANAVLGDVAIEMTISGERGPNQSEINAVTAFTGAANPAAVLALIAEIERLQHEKRTGDQACRSSLARERIYTQISTDLIEKHPHERSGIDWDYEHPLHGLIVGILSERDQLKAEVEALRKDAERYRWLRDRSEAFHSFYLSTPIWLAGAKFSKGNVDSSIDAAMSKEAGQ